MIKQRTIGTLSVVRVEYIVVEVLAATANLSVEVGSLGGANSTVESRACAGADLVLRVRGISATASHGDEKDPEGCAGDGEYARPRGRSVFGGAAEFGATESDSRA